MDEVLAELLEEVLKQNDYFIWGKKLTYEDISDYYIYNIDGVKLSIDEAIILFRNTLEKDIGKLEIKPCEGVYNKLLEWKKKWYKLKVITARAENLFKKYTLDWLDKYYPWIFDEVYFANSWNIKIKKNGKDDTKKSIICKNLWIDVMIEDNWDYAKDISWCGIKTYLIKKPWNINKPKLENVVLVDKFEDIVL